MRGKKARAIRKAAPVMHPALKREMKAEIAKHAAKRATAIGKSHRTRDEQMHAARVAEYAKKAETFVEQVAA